MRSSFVMMLAAWSPKRAGRPSAVGGVGQMSRKLSGALMAPWPEVVYEAAAPGYVREIEEDMPPTALGNARAYGGP